MKAPKPSKALKNFTLTEELRGNLRLSDKIFLRSLDHWGSVDELIKDYFIVAELHQPTAHQLYSIVLKYLTQLTNNETKIRKGVKTYCEKLDTYYNNSSIKLQFFEEYENQERAIRKKKARKILHDENRIAGNLMVGHMIKDSSSTLSMSSSRAGGLIIDNTSIDRSSNASSSKRRYEDLENDVDDTESIITTGDDDSDSRDEVPGNNEEELHPRESVWDYFKRLLIIGKDDERYHQYSALRNGVVLLGEGIKAHVSFSDTD